MSHGRQEQLNERRRNQCDGCNAEAPTHGRGGITYHNMHPGGMMVCEAAEYEDPDFESLLETEPAQPEQAADFEASRLREELEEATASRDEWRALYDERLRLHDAERTRANYLKGVLRRLEWSRDDMGRCPACLGVRDAGHSATCWMAASLSGEMDGGRAEKAEAEVAQLREENARLASGGRRGAAVLTLCRNPRCADSHRTINHGGVHRCWRDGRWLDDGSEM